jgi:hypothetical protein
MQIKNKKGIVLHDVPGDSLVGADLIASCLERADLRGADLRRANLCGADLCLSDLTGANLEGADLSGAHLVGADLSNASLPPPITPEKGDFIGYKKVLQASDEYTVITLRIPADAERTSALTSRKCRASHVVVVEGEGFSPTYQKELHYVPGEAAYADGFNSDRREECVQGIHFFMTREEAEAYQP